MTTRAQLQSKPIDELRVIAEAVGIETDGLQKSKLISALVDAGQVVEDDSATDVGELPQVTTRPERQADGDSNDGEADSGVSIEVISRGDDRQEFSDEFRGGNRQRRRRRGGGQRDDEFIPEEDLEVREGLLDILPEGYGFLRVTGYLPGDKDVYVSANQVRKFRLRKGDIVSGPIRPPRSKEKFPAVVRIDKVNGMTADEAMGRPKFESLTPLFPDQRLRLEVETKSNGILTRIVDLIAPIGKGQRGLIVSPPKAGKTTVLQEIAHAITTNNPECYLMVVLVDERPEEVTDMQTLGEGGGHLLHLRPPGRGAHPDLRARPGARQAPGRDGDRRRDPARLDHPTCPGPQPGDSGIGPDPLRWCRLPGPLSAKAVLRRCPQHRGRRLAHHPGDRSRRDRLQDGRGHLRGVQGDREHGAPPRSQAGRQADLSGHRHRSFGNKEGRAACSIRRS